MSGQSKLAITDEPILLELVAAGIADRFIAERFGVNVRTVERWRERRGLPSNWKPARTDRHGTPSRYSDGCRCDLCRDAHRIKVAARRKVRAVDTRANGLPAHVPHGLNAYTNWGCLCDVCRKAGADRNARDEQRRKERARS